jgi:septal ring factor EnvC (AmiA/AmiB activator)
MPCERRENGQLWTDGIIHYFNDGTVILAEGGSVVDLVEYLGPLPVPDQTAEIDWLRTEWQSELTTTQELRSENDRLQDEVLQAQKYMSEANEKINQQSTEINRLNRNVEEFERIDEHKDSEIDHLRQLRRTNEAIIKEFRELLTHALSNK